MQTSTNSSDDDSNGGDVEHVCFKLVLLGGARAGKTSLARRLAHGCFDPGGCSSTLGVEFYAAHVSLQRGGVQVVLQVIGFA